MLYTTSVDENGPNMKTNVVTLQQGAFKINIGLVYYVAVHLLYTQVGC